MSDLTGAGVQSPTVRADGSPTEPAGAPNQNTKEEDITAPAPGFTIEQKWIPGMLGISIERLRELRKAHCVQHVDYQKEGGLVMWTEAGVQKVRAALAIPAPAADYVRGMSVLLNEKKPEAPAKALIVRRAGPQLRNKRVCEVCWEGSDEPRMLLWVRDNTKFRAGLRVTEFRPRDVEGQFDYTGRRDPR